MSIDDILRDQDGVIGRKQVMEAGMTPAGIAWRLSTGAWVRVAPAVSRSAAHPETDRVRVRVRVGGLWLGDGATLIGVGAAWWPRMADEAPSRLRFAVPTTRRVRDGPGIEVLRRDVDDADRLEIDGVRVTTRALTVLDAVAEIGASAGADLMDRALLRDRVSVEGLRDAHWVSLGRAASRPSGACTGFCGARASPAGSPVCRSSCPGTAMRSSSWRSPVNASRSRLRGAHR